jgi:hypothetical protein
VALGAFGLDRAGTQVDQHFGDVDLDWAGVVASSAQADRERERGGVRDPGQLGGEDGANGAGIDRTVGVASGALIGFEVVEVAPQDRQRLGPAARVEVCLAAARLNGGKSTW